MNRLECLGKSSSTRPQKQASSQDIQRSGIASEEVLHIDGGGTHAPPPADGAPDEDEDIKAPVELIMEFLRAVMDRDVQLASKLCQMILIYEPDNPEASEFLPLIQKKLLEEEDDDNDSDGSGSEEESSQSSSCSSSSRSSSSPSDDDDEEKQVNRHKACPSHMSS